MTSKQKNQDSESALNRLVVGEIKSHKNTNQEVIVVSENTARLLLIEYQNSLKLRHEWKAPVAVLTSLVPTIVAVEKFHDAFSIPAAGWESILHLVVYASVIWFVVILIKISTTREMGNTDELINRLKEPDSGPKVKKSILVATKGRILEIFGRG